MSYKITVTLELDESFVESVLSIAIEGGCNYWAAYNKIVRDEAGNYVSIQMADMEDEDAEWATVDYDVITKGCQLAFEKLPHLSALIESILQQDGAIMDAADADCIVQLGLFGEVVYG